MIEPVQFKYFHSWWQLSFQKVYLQLLEETREHITDCQMICFHIVNKCFEKKTTFPKRKAIVALIIFKQNTT